MRDPGVHLTERWCGQRGEHGRMLRYGFRYAFAADQQGSDDLVCVALVTLEQCEQTVARRLPQGL